MKTIQFVEHLLGYSKSNRQAKWLNGAPAKFMLYWLNHKASLLDSAGRPLDALR